MAGLWYRAGTISVTTGSKKITGYGTLFKTGTYKPDKGHALYGPDGKAYEIDYVKSDSVLYLVKSYAGATASGQTYEIDITRTSTIPALSREISAQIAYSQSQYNSWQQVLTGTGDVLLTAPDGQQVTVPALANMLSKSSNLAGLTMPDVALDNLGVTDVGKAVSRATDAAEGRAALGAQAADATLTAIAGLNCLADRIPYFSGPDTVALSVFTSFARTLIDDADATAARVTLQTPARSTAPPDLNDIAETGIHKLTGNNANRPIGGNSLGDHVLHFQWDSAAAVQIYAPYVGQLLSWRRKSGSSWTTWFTIHTQETLPYESGTFTPLIGGSITDGVGTYTDQRGFYTRVGNQVFIDVRVRWTATTATGDLRVLGLPFTSTASSTGASCINIAGQNFATPIAGSLAGFLGGSSNRILVIVPSTSGGAWLTVPMKASGELVFSCTYRI